MELETLGRFILLTRNVLNLETHCNVIGRRIRMIRVYICNYFTCLDCRSTHSSIRARGHLLRTGCQQLDILVLSIMLPMPLV